MLSPETEVLTRELLTDKVAEAENVAFGIPEPVFFTGKEDFAGQNGILTPDKTDAENKNLFENLLCDFVMTSFARFDYTPRGTVACPVMKITYEFLVFQEFKKGLENETNAHNRHIATVLQIWSKFLTNRTLRSDPVIRHYNLEQVGKTAKNQVVEFLPGVRGFYTNLQTTVEVS